MKTCLPPKFEHIGPKSCASCYQVSKVLKTRTAVCERHNVTFPVYESAMNYVCNDHQPVVGAWSPVREGIIMEEPKNG